MEALVFLCLYVARQSRRHALKLFGVFSFSSVSNSVGIFGKRKKKHTTPDSPFRHAGAMTRFTEFTLVSVMQVYVRITICCLFIENFLGAVKKSPKIWPHEFARSLSLKC